MFYWIMTGLHALHVTIGIVAVLAMLVLARRGHFSPAYYSPVDVTALYWHFVDIGLDFSAADAVFARKSYNLMFSRDPPGSAGCQRSPEGRG